MRRLREAGAVSPETAVDLEQIGLRNSRVLQRLARREVVRLNPQGKYYLDVAAAEEFRKNRRRWALTALLIILAILVVILYFAARIK